VSAGAVFAAIYAKVNGTTGLTGGVWRDRAPRGTPFPFAVMSAEPVEVSDVLTGEAYFGGEWTVKVVDKGESATTADTVYATIHTALQNTTLTISGYTAMICRRRSFFSYDEDLEGGERAQHVGGTYRIMAAL
jgi:hypothetical protein